VFKVSIAIGLCAAACIIAGCGSSSSSSSAAGQSSTPKTAALTAKKCAPLTKAPINIVDISDATGLPGVPFADLPDAEGVAVQYVNTDLCGVDGHPLKLTKCDSKFDPAATSACANQAVSLTPLPVAQVGGSINLVTNGSKTLHAKNIITLNIPDTPQDFADADSFPLGGGGGAEYPAAAYVAATLLKTKKPASVLVGTPAAPAFNAQFEAALKQQGVTAPLKPVIYPPTAADVTPFAAESAQGHDAIITNASGSVLNDFYKDWKQQGISADKTINISASIDGNALKAASSSADGAYFTAEFRSPDDTSNPQVSVYRQAMAKYGPSFSADASFSQWGFSNVMTLYAVMKKLGGDNVTAASISKYFHSTPVIPVYMGTEINSASAPKGMPALRNLNVTVVQWDGSTFKPVNGGKFFVAPTAKG
jgi:branched-chain amino acid transport system substrate-binding protein